MSRDFGTINSSITLKSTPQQEKTRSIGTGSFLSPIATRTGVL